MSSSVWFPIAGLFFSIMILVVFFSKENINTRETRIYRYMIIINFLGLVLEILCTYASYIHDTNLLLSNFILKMYLVYNILFVGFLTYYTFAVSHSNIQDDTYNKIINPVLIVWIIFSSILIFVLPINLVVSDDFQIRYTNGPSVTFTYALCGVLIIYMLICTLLDIKHLKNKKYIPILTFLLVGLGGMALQIAQPGILILTFIETFVTGIMYHTIENPDVKMINELEVAREQADKANRAKTDFLSSMSHEIRTPLNAIVGFSDCIMDAQTIDEAKENAKDIVNASQTLLEIVNGILDISKIEAGKIEIVNSKYNAPETFLELAKLITPKMNEKGLDFTYNIAGDLPETLFGDHANIKKIVTNLLSNACKYTERGYVHYEVNCVNSNGTSKLIISVEDSGRGIKRENVDKMFTKFQRLDEDKNTTIEGTGLGLAITKQLIELMGGRIILHTVYGEGSKFTVVLNQKIETADAEIAKKVKETLDLNNVKIMLVDDTPLNLKVATKLLEKYNANSIVTCNSGFECLDRIKRGEEYDLILLDDMMPKMSGVETLKQLKEIEGFNTPTVALTANAISGMREKYLADGFDDYLAKPIEKDQLVLVVNQLLGRSITEDIQVSEVAKLVRTEEQSKPVEEKPDDIEQLEDVNPMDIKPIETIPVVSIDTGTEIPEKVDNSKVYDRSYLEKNGADIDHALELLGDMDMYNMTISDFMKEVEAKWGRIIEYKNQDNMPDYAIEVHSLKSDCKYLGFMTLADIAYEHELKSKEGDSNFVNENFERLENEYKKVLEIAKVYVEHNPVSE